MSSTIYMSIVHFYVCSIAPSSLVVLWLIEYKYDVLGEIPNTRLCSTYSSNPSLLWDLDTSSTTLIFEILLESLKCLSSLSRGGYPVAQARIPNTR